MANDGNDVEKRTSHIIIENVSYYGQYQNKYKTYSEKKTRDKSPLWPGKSLVF